MTNYMWHHFRIKFCFVYHYSMIIQNNEHSEYVVPLILQQ